ncbi:MAG: DUF2065 domain-containing protein [Sphingomonadales bacterium]
MAEKLLLGLAIALVFEGIVYALFPDQMRGLVAKILEEPTERIRGIGLMTACLGLFLAWLVL